MAVKAIDTEMPFLAQPRHSAFVDGHLLGEEAPARDWSGIQLDDLDGFGRGDHYLPLRLMVGRTVPEAEQPGPDMKQLDELEKSIGP